MRHFAAVPVVFVAGLLLACGGRRPEETTLSGCGCTVDGKWYGRDTLQARDATNDYQRATMSFEHAMVLDDGTVNNDWDLEYGNDGTPDEDLFTVNTVTDDRSFLVDLGEKTLSEIPEVVDVSKYVVGRWGDHDNLPVRLNHLYVVRTLDRDTRQFAAFFVVEHELNRSVTLQWFRSSDPDRFVLKW